MMAPCHSLIGDYIDTFTKWNVPSEGPPAVQFNSLAASDCGRPVSQCKQALGSFQEFTAVKPPLLLVINWICFHSINGDDVLIWTVKIICFELLEKIAVCLNIYHWLCTAIQVTWLHQFEPPHKETLWLGDFRSRGQQKSRECLGLCMSHKHGHLPCFHIWIFQPQIEL